LARLLEANSKNLLANYGIITPRFQVATTPEEVLEIVVSWRCPIVLKAHIPIGRRGKAGAVLFAASPQEAADCARKLLGTTVRHFPVTSVLVEEQIAIEQEYYASISFDASKRSIVAMVSPVGGVDIEEIAVKQGRFFTMVIEPFRGLQVFEARQLWVEAGLSGRLLLPLTEALVRLYQLFVGVDATIVEVNPLVLNSERQAVAIGALIGVDDNALYRHPELSGQVEPGSDQAWHPLSEREKQAIAVDRADPYRGTARYTEMDGGDVGFLCGGGGGSLLMFDALCRFGGAPANYSETGGNPTERKVFGITRVIASKPGVKGLLVCINITNNTQTDVVAAGVVRALQDLNIDPRGFPTVVRLAGLNEGIAARICTEAGLEYYSDDITMEDAALRIVERMQHKYQEPAVMRHI
jgi:succinyl-CoA synthetase beta subunit